MDIPLGWQLLIQVTLIAINAVFASAEIAVVSMNDLKLERLAAQGDKRARRLLKLTTNPAKFLATIQVAITLAGFLGSAFAADSFSDIIVEKLIEWGSSVSPGTLNTIAVIIITIILSYLTLVFGELVPKRIAMKKAEKIALGLSGLIFVSSGIFSPIVWLLTASTNLILRLFRIDPNANEEDVSEEEIRMLVDVGSQKGVIDADEKEMIVNVFEFDDKECGEFSTHRKDILALDIEDPVEEWDRTIIASTHSVYPVYKESIDNVVAILDSKKYLRLKDKSKQNIEKYAFSAPIYVPESMKIDYLFKQMQKGHNHFAVVLDEYGGTEGIITMNDLLEQLVGDLENDEQAADDEPDIMPMGEGSWKMKGFVSLDEVAEITRAKLPVDDYETLSGYIFGLYYSIPKDGSKFDIETPELKISVLNVKFHTVESAVVTRKETDISNGE